MLLLCMAAIHFYGVYQLQSSLIVAHLPFFQKWTSDGGDRTEYEMSTLLKQLFLTECKTDTYLDGKSIQFPMTLT
ncbi:DUF1275 domain-containing protein [Histoplasma capsulatum var. duboisii H88]|uniref:DUF1275 domain-containing protein n=1 Tax=Ajellomyces capsulatus (strain H88) TaxID=544711 RepID=A0A8A1LHI3_AJEC8|nr:DUF1275 domain-containing protein [Histoplasma capsulatum var. duboisii H88]